MAYEQKEGDLSLFRNDKKQAGSNQPDMRGKALINGVVYKISAWTKESNGNRFLSGKIEVDSYVAPPPSPAPAYTPPPATGLPPSEDIGRPTGDTSWVAPGVNNTDPLPF